MKIKNLLIAVFVIATAMFSGCAKDGATGPQGPAGANGTANINISTFTATPGSWSNPSSGVYNVSASVSAITNADVDLVQVYAQTTNGGSYFAIPQSNFLVNGDDMSDAYTTGSVTIIYLNSSAPSISILFKIVVIPPSLVVNHPYTNWKDYNQVMAIMEAQNVNSNKK